MKKTYTLLVLILLIISCETVNKNEFAIVIHGGAGTILKENMSNELETAYRDKMKEALEAGHYILKNSGTSVDAVEAAIKILEDSELFNAGRGSVLSNNEEVEMDASIMTGHNLNAGAISGIKQIKNPLKTAKNIKSLRKRDLAKTALGAGIVTLLAKKGRDAVVGPPAPTPKRYAPVYNKETGALREFDPNKTSMSAKEFNQKYTIKKPK